MAAPPRVRTVALMSTTPATSLDLYEPGDPGYADACTLFNSMIERRPRYVAACSAPDDVVLALALAREQGLLLAVELVTADGRWVRASAEEPTELLWAMRGGGGNFGVVTAIEMKLHPVGP